MYLNYNNQKRSWTFTNDRENSGSGELLDSKNGGQIGVIEKGQIASLI